jgi:hypothetical protein
VAKFSTVDPTAWSQVLDDLRSDIRACATLECASQQIAKGMHERFSEASVLTRVYALLKHADLPPDVSAFVNQLAKDDPTRIAPATPVLTLLGTYGAQEAWCDRHRSRGHKGIPLLSGEFVDAIPMLARLLRELGIDLSWLDEAPEVATRRLLGGFNGTFYVQEAAAARDAQGRRIIPAAEFVSEHGVKTVFGNGGFYPDGTLIVCIVFTRETLTRSTVERFASLISMLKGETFGLIRGRKLFDFTA